MKKRIVKITAGQTFFFKSKCKKCASGPRYVYFKLNMIVNNNSLYDIKDFYNEIGLEIKSDDFYLEHSIKNRSFSPSYMFDGDSSSLRKLPIPNIKYQQNLDIFDTIIECECGQTNWAFVNSCRDHIKNRKCKLNINTNEVYSLNK